LKQLIMNVLPAAGVIFALNLYTATSRAELAGLEKSTAANISAVKDNISAVKDNIAALKDSTAANISAVKDNISALKDSTAANISAVKESTDAKIDASNKILYGYTSILDRMSKDASSKQQ